MQAVLAGGGRWPPLYDAQHGAILGQSFFGQLVIVFHRYGLVRDGGLYFFVVNDSSEIVILLNSLHWNTTFPAVSVCQLLNDETMAEMLEK